MTFAIRRATADDAGALIRIGAEAFGIDPIPEPIDPMKDGRRTWVAVYDEDAPIASVVHRPYESWFWGERVPTCGIAGVKIAAEHRGKGLLRQMLIPALRAARGEGCVLSTLFPTAFGIYRGLGYEAIGAYDAEVRVPTHAFTQVARGQGTLRRIRPDDLPNLHRVYDAWASAQNGPLTRQGPSFTTTSEELAELMPSSTLAIGPTGEVEGFCLWKRRGGAEVDGIVEVVGLVAVTDDALRNLMASLGTHHTVAPTTHLSTSRWDVVRLLLPSCDWTLADERPYMLTLLDVRAALTGRSYPTWADVAWEMNLVGSALTDLDGPYRIHVRSGRAEVTRIDGDDASAEGVTTVTARALACLYAGSQSPATLRAAGLMHGGPDVDRAGTACDPVGDEAWATLFGGREVHIQDYF